MSWISSIFGRQRVDKHQSRTGDRLVAPTNHTASDFSTTQSPASILSKLTGRLALDRNRFNLMSHMVSERYPQLAQNLSAIANGNADAILPVIDSIGELPTGYHMAVHGALKLVAEEHPYAARHLFYPALWNRSNFFGRGEIIRELTSSIPELVSYKMMGEMFIGLMEGAANDERRFEIRPMLARIVEEPCITNPRTLFLRGALKDFYEGWSSEDPHFNV